MSYVRYKFEIKILIFKKVMSINSKFLFSAHALTLLKFFLHEVLENNLEQIIQKPHFHNYNITETAAILVSHFSAVRTFFSQRDKNMGAQTQIKNIQLDIFSYSYPSRRSKYMIFVGCGFLLQVEYVQLHIFNLCSGPHVFVSLREESSDY